MPVDEIERLAGEDLRQVLTLLHDLPAAEDGSLPHLGERQRAPVLDPFGGRLDVDRAALHAEELVEATVEGVLAVAPAQLPLADGAGRVAGGAHDLGQGRLVRVQAVVPARRVEFVALPLRVASRHQAGTGRAADGRGDVAGLEPDAAAGEFVDVRGVDDLAAVDADVAVAEVVGQDEDDVGRAACLFGGRVGGAAECRDEDGREDEEAAERSRPGGRRVLTPPAAAAGGDAGAPSLCRRCATATCESHMRAHTGCAGVLAGFRATPRSGGDRSQLARPKASPHHHSGRAPRGAAKLFRKHGIPPGRSATRLRARPGCRAAACGATPAGSPPCRRAARRW